MNPYSIIAALLIAMGLWFGGEYRGHSTGVAEQKVADQIQFDKINAGLTKQKTDAATLYQNVQASIIALQTERDTFKTQLGEQHAKDQAATDAARSRYSNLKLRFRATQGERCGGSSSGSVPGSTNPTGATGAKTVELPTAVTSNLRQLAFDADQLADNYRLCYNFTRQMK